MPTARHLFERNITWTMFFPFPEEGRTTRAIFRFYAHIAIFRNTPKTPSPLPKVAACYSKVRRFGGRPRSSRPPVLAGSPRTERICGVDFRHGLAPREPGHAIHRSRSSVAKRGVQKHCRVGTPIRRRDHPPDSADICPASSFRCFMFGDSIDHGVGFAVDGSFSGA